MQEFKIENRSKISRTGVTGRVEELTMKVIWKKLYGIWVGKIIENNEIQILPYLHRGWRGSY
jgi:hypothetical protein